MWQRAKKSAKSMAKSKYRVIISAEASSMFGEHIKFLAQVSPKAALSLSRELLARLKVLESSPYLYPAFISEKVKTEYRKVSHKRFIVLYLVNEKEKVIEVEHIWDTRRNND